MAYKSYNKLWESEFDNIVSKRDKLQDMNINQLKLEIQDTYKKHGKVTTDFKLFNNEYVINKAYLDGKSKITVTSHFLKKITTNFNYNTTNNL